MEIAFFDNLAVNGKSFLHNASTLSKFIFTAIIINCVIISRGINELIFIAVLQSVLIIAIRLPIKRIFMAAFNPMFFSLVFAVTKYPPFGYDSLLVLLKTFSAVLSVLILISATPFTELFSLLGHFLPSIITDALFVTYRSIFILIQQLDNHLTIMKIRGGFNGGFINSIKNFSSLLGLVIIRSIDLSERMYHILKIRGYKGKIYSGKSFLVFNKQDIVSYILAVGTIMAVILL
ncbi:MAG TPA: hypothetical protein GXZ31_00655 [Thermoanaerobacterales bacterium]|nr:hypothetical protein [Thermoanaerobacterales bacterium]